jgi:hypothetical protein
MAPNLKSKTEKYVWYNARLDKIRAVTLLGHLYLKIYETILPELTYLGLL